MRRASPYFRALPCGSPHLQQARPSNRAMALPRHSAPRARPGNRDPRRRRPLVPNERCPSVRLDGSDAIAAGNGIAPVSPHDPGSDLDEIASQVRRRPVGHGFGRFDAAREGGHDPASTLGFGALGSNLRRRPCPRGRHARPPASPWPGHPDPGRKSSPERRMRNRGRRSRRGKGDRRRPNPTTPRAGKPCRDGALTGVPGD